MPTFSSHDIIMVKGNIKYNVPFLTQNVPAGFNVYKIVERMRQQRPAMVQAKDQYLFVYLAVVELAKRALGQQPSVPPKPENVR